MLILLSLLACASPRATAPAEEPAAEALEAAAPEAAQVPVTEAPDAAAPGSAWDGVVTGEGTLADGVAIATDLRVGLHDGYDRVVIEFDAGVPRYELSYVDAIKQAGSGRPVEVAGAVSFLIALEPAYGHDDAGAATVPGSADTAGLKNVVQASRVDDYEGQLRFAVGLGARVDPEVRTLSDPARLVIDFPHP